MCRRLLHNTMSSATWLQYSSSCLLHACPLSIRWPIHLFHVLVALLLIRCVCASAEKQKKESAKRGRPSEDDPSDSKASKKQKKQDEKGKAKKLSKEELAKQRQKDSLLEVRPQFQSFLHSACAWPQQQCLHLLLVQLRCYCSAQCFLRVPKI